MKPSNKSFAKIFDTIATKYDAVSNHYTVSRRINFFKNNAIGKCLEVGAGTGKVSIQLAKHHKVIATDISSKMVKQIAKNNIKAVVCDSEKLPFAAKSFDTVISSEVIYYLDHPERFIKEAYRVLKPNGRLLISSASEKAQIYDVLRAILRKIGVGNMYFDDKNRSFMSEKSLVKLLKNGDFRIKSINHAVIIPFGSLDFINGILEKTFLNTFGCFIFVHAQKRPMQSEKVS